MHPVTGWCDGCLRTLAEIAAWGQMTDEQRRTVWQALPARAAAAARAEGTLAPRTPT